MTATIEIARQTEVQTNRFGVTDMQITVRLGRKAGNNLRVLTLRQIAFNDLADEITGAGCCGVGFAHAVQSLVLTCRCRRRNYVKKDMIIVQSELD